MPASLAGKSIPVSGPAPMYETAWAVDVVAAAAPPMPELGPTPVLQVFGGIIALLVFALGALFWLRGERSKSEAPKGEAPTPGQQLVPQDSGAHLYFDGPLKEIFVQLKA